MPVNYTVNVYENNLPQKPVLNITGTDADEGQNGEITYSILSGNNQSYFELDSQVFIKRRLYTARNAQVAASLLQACYLAVIKPISGYVHIACSGLMITSLLQVVNRLDAS